ncbi:hypothetical protein HPE56_04915 [Maribacter sp. ANRC-HE7]|uniref:Fibronectin type-III domain-containing protein n=2 Tax=Maribacter aquimaris TaxID=2737171 RepID=A0ABR7UX45_9FLAO|nr:hypothetical protein [Maribacter aquimaris]
MKTVKYILPVILIGILISCGGDGNDDNPDPVIVSPPEAATLIFPENNTECIEGTIISDTESSVTFLWNASENTDSYTVNLRNLDTNTSQNLSASTNELVITLMRGTPYSWSVTSKADDTDETAESNLWKFYNAGPAVENYAPFPADVIYPTMGSSIDAGSITLSWEGSDVDNDIDSYDIYIDENNPPSTLLGNTTSSGIDFEAISGKVYYWKVTTKDASGNSSNSEIFQFKVN